MPATEPGPRDAVRAQIREFLSTRRARLTPEQAGLPTYGGARRRVPGLRREETALLIGVSPQYYVRLERGDAVGVSDGVIDGIARALRLDDAERAHLLDLLRVAGAPQAARRGRSAQPTRARPALRATVLRLVEALDGVPAFVLTARLDVVAGNALGWALFAPLYAEPQSGRPNAARAVFLDPAARSFYRDWGDVADDTVAVLRAEAGRDPYDRELTDLVGELSTRSDDFRVRWAAHDVRIHTTGVKRLHHPVVGPLDLPYESLPLEAAGTSSLVTYLPAAGSAAHDALALLASWTAGALPASARSRHDPSRDPG